LVQDVVGTVINSSSFNANLECSCCEVLEMAVGIEHGLRVGSLLVAGSDCLVVSQQFLELGGASEPAPIARRLRYIVNKHRVVGCHA
jgi:hypothetical protein